MNPTIKTFAENTQVSHYRDENARDMQKASLLLFASLVNDEFLDIPEVPADRFAQDGVFYQLQNSNVIRGFVSHETRSDLLVVFKVENGESFCPVRIELVTEGGKDFKISVINQTKSPIQRETLVGHDENGYYSAIGHTDTFRLSEIVEKIVA